jgi:hypothetical protein
MEMEELGCGVATHGADCLCDVVITHALPPLGQCMTNAVQDMWMGKEMCKMRGYGIPWRDSDILSYLEDMEKFYDAFHSNEKLNNHDAMVLKDMEPILHDDSDSPYEKWGDIRDAVHYAMDRFDDDLNTILRQLHITPQEFIDSATTLKGGSGWTEKLVDQMETMFMDINPNYAQIARDLGVTVAVVHGLRKYWIQRRKRKDYEGTKDPAAEYMHSLCRNTNMTPKDIIAEVKEKYGKVYARSSVSRYRTRASGGK